MDLILATSRGASPLDEYLAAIHPSPKHLHVISIPGTSLETLTQIGIKIINKSTNPSQYHVYFMAGLCDLTRKDNDIFGYRKKGIKTIPIQYDEVTFPESSSQAVPRLKSTINSIAHQISSTGASPCFMTIPTCSLKKWNETRLKYRKTEYLLHSSQYDDMQGNLNRAIKEINHHILDLNTTYNMHTPKIANTIMKTSSKTTKSGIKKSSKKKKRTLFSQLPDGVHPKNHLRKKWAKIIIQSIANNRSPPSLNKTPVESSSSESETDTNSDDENHPRSWLTY